MKQFSRILSEFWGITKKMVKKISFIFSDSTKQMEKIRRSGITSPLTYGCYLITQVNLVKECLHTSEKPKRSRSLSLAKILFRQADRSFLVWYHRRRGAETRIAQKRDDRQNLSRGVLWESWISAFGQICSNYHIFLCSRGKLLHW